MLRGIQINYLNDPKVFQPIELHSSKQTFKQS